MDDPASHLDFLLGDRFTEADPEAASLRSHPSSHADQTLLPHAAPARTQTQRLQRRRNQYYYVNGNLVPAASLPAASATGGPAQQQQQQWFPPRSVHAAHQEAQAQAQAQAAAAHKRAKSYGPSGHASSWLLGSAAGAFADTKRQSWTGERREIRKLQKDHPMGSARPSCTFEIGDGDETSTGGAAGAAAGAAAGGAAEREGVRGSVLGVRRKMERLKGLYRRGEKEVEVSSNLR